MAQESVCPKARRYRPGPTHTFFVNAVPVKEVRRGSCRQNDAPGFKRGCLPTVDCLEKPPIRASFRNRANANTEEHGTEMRGCNNVANLMLDERQDQGENDFSGYENLLFSTIGRHEELQRVDV